MSEIGSKDRKYATTLKSLARDLFKETCLIFLGSGASLPVLPSAEALSKDMADETGLPWYKYVPLSTISFYYEFLLNREDLISFVEKKITGDEIKPNATIKRLIDIIEILEKKNKKVFVISTNYDLLFEMAYKDKFKQEPGVIIYEGASDAKDRYAKLHLGLDLPPNVSPQFWLPTKKTYLYKMHGCISKPERQNLVITEEDYINFLTNALSTSSFKQLLHYARGQIGRSTILFVGYSLSDWNFRVLFKTTAEEFKKQSYAVQVHVHGDDTFEDDRWKASIDFWSKKEVDIINTKAADFMKELLVYVKKEAASGA